MLQDDVCVVNCDFMSSFEYLQDIRAAVAARDVTDPAVVF